MKVKYTPGQNLYEQAVTAYNRRDAVAGARLLKAAFELTRDLPGPWFQYGVIAAEGKNHRVAVAAMRRAAEIMPNDPHVLTNLAWELYKCGRFDEALVWVDRAVAVAPGKAMGWTDKALIEIALRVSGVASARRAMALAPDSLQSQMALAFALCFDECVYDGLLAYEARIPGRMPEFQGYPLPRWDGRVVKKLFVAAEQGLGDTLQFARYLAEATLFVGEIVFCVQPELVRLFEVYFANVAWCSEISRVQIVRMPAEIPPDADAYVPLMSLPTTLADYKECRDKDAFILSFDAAYIPMICLSDTHVLAPPGPRKRVGVVWAGSPEQEVDDQRSATPEDFLRLYDVPGIEIVSLQMGKRKHAAESAGPLFTDCTDDVKDMLDTARIMVDLDAVVTVCTSVAHLALALGVDTHIVLPRHGQHWVWGHGDVCPWYPKAHLYRQERMGDWSAPMAAVAVALKEKFGGTGN